MKYYEFTSKKEECHELCYDDVYFKPKGLAIKLPDKLRGVYINPYDGSLVNEDLIEEDVVLNELEEQDFYVMTMNYNNVYFKNKRNEVDINSLVCDYNIFVIDAFLSLKREVPEILLEKEKKVAKKLKDMQDQNLDYTDIQKFL